VEIGLGLADGEGQFGNGKEREFSDKGRRESGTGRLGEGDWKDVTGAYRRRVGTYRSRSPLCAIAEEGKDEKEGCVTEGEWRPRGEERSKMHRGEGR